MIERLLAVLSLNLMGSTLSDFKKKSKKNTRKCYYYQIGHMYACPYYEILIALLQGQKKNEKQG